MALQVIGAGFGRTGTSSLKAALEALGFGPCYHMTELLAHPERVRHWGAAERGEAVDWDALFEGYRAAVDFPTYRQYRALADHYPEAKVILTVREPEAWYKSVLTTTYRASPPPLQTVLFALRLPFSNRLRRLLRALNLARGVWRKDFGGRFGNRAYALERYQAHLEEVQRAVPAERLLVFDVRQGWGPLCDFLGVAVPEGPFPHLNDRVSFGHSLRRSSRELLNGRRAASGVSPVSPRRVGERPEQVSRKVFYRHK